MKNLSWLILTVFALFLFASCGGSENDSVQTDEDDSVAVSLRVARDADSGCTGMELDCLTKELAAISFQIRNGNGETVFQKSFARNDLKNLKEIKGIKNADNATLIVSVFLGSDTTTPKWQGKASGLKFEKGKTTSVTILLYPIATQPKEISMPEGLTIARFGHSATVLGDGRILVAGGFPSCGANGKCVATESVEIIDIESGMIESSTGENKTLVNLNEKRAMHTTIALNDGSVLFIGGVQGFSAISQEEAFEDFPILPYSQLNAVTTIERYMPAYPKHNMKTNGSGTPIANYTENIPADIPFMAFQSIHAERISDTQTDVFLVGGVDEAGVPSNKAYKFTITETEDGEVLVSEAAELAESSTPMILPALAYSNGSIFAVGGRNNSSESAASLISESESKDLGEKSNNIFFTNSLYANNSLYTFGGLPNESGNLVNSDQDGVIRKWDIDGSAKTPDSKNLLRTWGKNIAFAGTLFDSERNRLIVVGGTDAEDLYQVINAADLELFGSSPTHKMSDKRIMPQLSVVPAGIIGERPILVITGGTSALDSTGSAANSIKINIL